MSLNPGQFLVPPDVEAALVAALTDYLGVPVATEWPRVLPGSFVVVSATGDGFGGNLVQASPAHLVECFGPGSVAASKLARSAVGRLTNEALGWPGVSVSRVSCSWPVNYPDPRTSKSRYQFTVSAVVDLEVVQ